MSLSFIKTYELEEFKAAVKTSNIRVFRNPEGAGYFRYLENNITEKVFPLTSKSTIEETLEDPVISLASKIVAGQREPEVMYMMHHRAASGHELVKTL